MLDKEIGEIGIGSGGITVACIDSGVMLVAESDISGYRRVVTLRAEHDDPVWGRLIGMIQKARDLARKAGHESLIGKKVLVVNKRAKHYGKCGTVAEIYDKRYNAYSPIIAYAVIRGEGLGPNGFRTNVKNIEVIPG
jgi:hypothetical protein